MFQRKIDEMFKEIPNIGGTTDDILVVGYDKDGTDQSGKLHTVLHMHQKTFKA